MNPGVLIGQMSAINRAGKQGILIRGLPYGGSLGGWETVRTSNKAVILPAGTLSLVV